MDRSKNLTLDSIHRSLIHQEDNIIFSLLERAQSYYNVPSYDVNAFTMLGFSGSLIRLKLREIEILHAKVRLLKFKQLSKNMYVSSFVLVMTLFGMLWGDPLKTVTSTSKEIPAIGLSPTIPTKSNPVEETIFSKTSK